MRLGASAAVAGLLLSVSCGYVGPVVPPSPQLPAAVTDLTVAERGDKLEIQFTTPARTTDNLAVKRFEKIDLRIGPAVAPFDFTRWETSAKQYELTPPPPNNPDDPRPQPMSDSVPAADWLGQRIAVAVRTSSKNEGHFSAWSNVVRVDVVPPLQPPTVDTQPTADGIRLRWKPAPEGTTFRIYRSGPSDQKATEIGTANTGEYLDRSAQYDTAYTYQVVATRGAAESLPSAPTAITAKDVFPPSVPTGVAALATPESIEVSWQRSPERDLKGYYLYRSTNGGAFERLGDLLSLPTYSDRSAERGKTYRYEVSSVDQKNNESARSTPVEVTF